MKEIQLTQDKVAIVDDEDFERLNQYKWRTQRIGYLFYGARWGRKTTIMLHREVLNLKHGDGRMVDHINNDGLDCRKQNLRYCTHAENMRNRKRRGIFSSLYKGVCWHKRNKKWAAMIRHNKIRINLGTFENEYEASVVYNKKAKELHGCFAN